MVFKVYCVLGKGNLISYCAPPLSAGGRRVEPLTKFSNFLLYMLNIFPLSAACVERLVSMKIKTNLIKVDKSMPEKPTVPSKA